MDYYSGKRGFRLRFAISPSRRASDSHRFHRSVLTSKTLLTSEVLRVRKEYLLSFNITERTTDVAKPKLLNVGQCKDVKRWNLSEGLTAGVH